MAKVVCVLYDDPVDGYPKKYARDDIPKITKYPDGQTTPTPSAIDFKPGELLGSVSGELGLRKFLEKAGHTLVVTSDKDGAEFKARQGAARRRDRDLAAVLARLHDQGADREGEEAQAHHHGGHRLGPHRSASGDGQGRHRCRGHLLQLHQRRRAYRHDDPGAGPQLYPFLRLGHQRRLEHRRLRRAVLRPRGHECRHGRCRPYRHCRAQTVEAVRREASLLRQAPTAQGGGAGARPHVPSECRVAW